MCAFMFACTHACKFWYACIGRYTKIWLYAYISGTLKIRAPIDAENNATKRTPNFWKQPYTHRDIYIYIYYVCVYMDLLKNAYHHEYTYTCTCIRPYTYCISTCSCSTCLVQSDQGPSCMKQTKMCCKHRGTRVHHLCRHCQRQPCLHAVGVSSAMFTGLVSELRLGPLSMATACVRAASGSLSDLQDNKVTVARLHLSQVLLL